MKAVALALVVFASATSLAGEKAYVLPKRIVCPVVSFDGVSVEQVTLELGLKKYELTESEARGGDLATLVGADQWRGGEYAPGAAVISKNKKGELELSFGYAGCDGGGSYDFPLSNVLREAGKTEYAEVYGRASAEIRGYGIDVAVICKGVY